MKKTYTENLIYLSTSENILLESPLFGQEMLDAIEEKKYKFAKYLHKGLEGILILARDIQNARDVIFKFAIPQLCQEKQTFFSKFGESIPFFQQRKSENFKNLKETNIMKRFLRSAYLQQQISDIIRKNNLEKYGNVPFIYSIGKENKLYVEMEFIQGKDLIEFCKGFDDYQIFQIWLKILKLIEFALHNNNIIHSDIKPYNFICTEKQIFLIDFGLTKSLKVDYNITKKSDSMGSFFFAPKDQFLEFSKRDYSCDIFALSVLLYYMYLRLTPEEWVKKRNITNFLKLHHIKEIENIGVRYIFQRGIRAGFPYENLTEMREDFEFRVMNLYEKKQNLNKSFIQEIIKIWEKIL